MILRKFAGYDEVKDGPDQWIDNYIRSTFWLKNSFWKQVHDQKRSFLNYRDDRVEFFF